MTTDATMTLGERVSELRTRRGMSQRELAAEVGRSESWVSQVERYVLQIDRLPVLQALADALGVALSELRPEATAAAAEQGTTRGEGPSDLDALRLTVTGHPAALLLLDPPAPKKVDLANGVTEAWRLTHASAFRDASTQLTKVLPRLEEALRAARPSDRQRIARLLADVQSGKEIEGRVRLIEAAARRSGLTTSGFAAEAAIAAARGTQPPASEPWREALAEVMARTQVRRGGYDNPKERSYVL
jgi:transcriptional regulator with XRE-family HTH domain